MHLPVLYVYLMGLGVGFNRSKNFYAVNNIPQRFGSYHLPDGYFLKPEVGFTFYNKKKKPF